MAITFDGINKIISFDSLTTQVEALTIYSKWKEWIQQADNAKYLPAFANSVGGESLGGGVSTGQYFFLQNGWKIKPYEANHKLTVVGNLFPIPDSAALFQQTTGTYNVQIETRNSALTQALSTSGGSSVWSSTEKGYVLDSLASLLSNPTVSNKTRIIAHQLLGELKKTKLQGRVIKPSIIGIAYKKRSKAEVFREPLIGNLTKRSIKGLFIKN